MIRFDPLSDSAMEAIARKYLRQLQDRAAAVGTQLLISEALPDHLRQQCKGKGGARQMRKLVQSQVEGPLATYLLRCSRRPGKVKVRLEEGAVTFVT